MAAADPALHPAEVCEARGAQDSVYACSPERLADLQTKCAPEPLPPANAEAERARTHARLYIDSVVRVTLRDGRVIVGNLRALDGSCTLVLSDAVSFCLHSLPLDCWSKPDQDLLRGRDTPETRGRTASGARLRRSGDVHLQHPAFAGDVVIPRAPIRKIEALPMDALCEWYPDTVALLQGDSESASATTDPDPSAESAASAESAKV